MLSKLVPVQLELREANAFVAQVHRHHKPLHRVRFSVGCADETGKLRAPPRADGEDEEVSDDAQAWLIVAATIALLAAVLIIGAP